jgi:hypothetical protein
MNITKAQADRIIKMHDDGKSRAEIVEATDRNLYAVWAVLAASGRTSNSAELTERAKRAVGDAVTFTKKAATPKPPAKKAAAPKAKTRTKKLVNA